MKTKLQHIIVTLLLISGNLLAQTNYLNNIRINNVATDKEHNNVGVSMQFVLDDIKAARNEMITFTPVLVSKIGPDSLKLPAVIITGATRDKVLRRNIVLNNHTGFSVEPYTIVKRENGKPQRIQYFASTPYSEWMGDAELHLLEKITGCADCEKGENYKLLSQVTLPGRYMPVYKLTYIVPEVEPVKERADKHTATLNFRVDKHDLEWGYRNNAAILAEVDNIVSKIVSNNDLSVSDFTIVGYASPEASVSYNKALSERRANAFADYLSNKFNVARNRMKVTGYGEDWAKTREVIASSNIADKSEILRIIDNVANPDARDAELKKLSDGATYQTMLRDYYPLIRRTEYTVAYEVRAFNVEEAKQIIRTNPKLLSLNEMYLVAQTYPAESKEFKEVFDIATRLYPNEPIAILNSAAADIEGGNNQAAIDRLTRIETDQRVWNNLAVAYARMNELQKAKTYFEKAASRGDSDAQKNLQELQKVMSEL